MKKAILLWVLLVINPGPYKAIFNSLDLAAHSPEKITNHSLSNLNGFIDMYDKEHPWKKYGVTNLYKESFKSSYSTAFPLEKNLDAGMTVVYKNEADKWLHQYDGGLNCTLPEKIGRNKLYRNNFGIPYYAAYFVDGSASKSGNGSLSMPFKTIQEGINMARAGDIVYVKAANYGAVYNDFVRSGTPGNYIKFIGYTATPGDIISLNGPTYSKEMWERNGNTFPDNIMPLLDNNPVNNIPGSSEAAFKVTVDYIQIENFMVQDYYDGVVSPLGNRSSNFTAINFIAARLGNWNPNAICWGQPDSNKCDNRTGYGIHLRGISNWEVRNSLVIDAGHVGINIINSDHGFMENCTVWSATTGNATDYNIVFYGSSFNTAKNLQSYRNKGKSNSSHQGRAFAMKCSSSNNLIDGLYAENLRFQLYANANDNVIKNVTLKGTGDINDSGFQVWGQANRNLIINLQTSNGGGIAFLGYNNRECKPAGIPLSSGENNWFINPIVSDLPALNGNAGIQYHRLPNNGQHGGTNYIIGGTFDKVPYLINANRPGTIHLINTSLSNIYLGYHTFYASPFASDYRKNIRVYYDHVNFYNCNFKIPSGSNITTYNPGYEDSKNGNYRIRISSPVASLGKNPIGENPEAGIDADNKPRGTIISLGAYNPH